MAVDPITEEIRAIRHALAAQFGNDITAIMDDVRRREALDGRKYVSCPPRQPELDDLHGYALEPANPATPGGPTAAPVN